MNNWTNKLAIVSGEREKITLNSQYSIKNWVKIQVLKLFVAIFAVETISQRISQAFLAGLRINNRHETLINFNKTNKISAQNYTASNRRQKMQNSVELTKLLTALVKGLSIFQPFCWHLLGIFTIFYKILGILFWISLIFFEVRSQKKHRILIRRTEYWKMLH